MASDKAKYLIVCLLLSIITSASSALTVSTTETWAGAPMHGITPTGSGTAASPYVYAIADGMILTGSGVIKMGSKYVTFDLNSATAGLDMAAGSYFDLTGSSRLSDPGACRITLGANNLTGSGDFKTADISKDSMDVNIVGTGDVSVNSFYMRTSDAYAGDVYVDVAGSVSIVSVDTHDQASGGNDGGNVTIRGADVTAGAIDTRSMRTASSTAFSGNVVLQARDTSGVNTLNNTLNLHGVINTDAASGTDGNVTISGVVVRLESGFNVTKGGGLLNIHAGAVQYGKTAAELFVDNSGGGYSATHDVPWSGFGASNPSPGDNAVNVDPNVVLGWAPALSATAHEVYFGTNFETVTTASDPNSAPGRGRHDANTYAPAGLLELGTTYYWRIDEVNDANINSPWRGSVWSFTVADGKAGNPNPADGTWNIQQIECLCWTAGALAILHDVYLGTDFNDVQDANTDVPLGVYRGRHGANSYDPRPTALNTTYYWRIDEVGTGTLVKGSVWGFTVAETYTNSLGMSFIRIPPGTVIMGQGDGHRIQDSGTVDYDEQPAHLAKISKPFYVLMAHVSQTQYQQSGLPGLASDVSWNDANAFAQWLSSLEGKTYRLPTEAEWHYLWSTPRGIQDMNIREWVQDWHSIYVNDDQVDPIGPAKGILKVIRGDGENRLSLEINSRYQPWQLPEASACGFRLVFETEAPLVRYASPGPFCQAAVKQSTAPALQGPDPDIPYFTVRFALPIPPDNISDGVASLLGCDPSIRSHNHSPGFEILPNGDALGIWFSGAEENGPKVRFVQARLRYGSDQWDMPELFYHTKGLTCSSGLLWTETDGTVHFFGGDPGVTNSERRPFVMASSNDNGATWNLKRPYFPVPAVDFTAQPVTNAWRLDSTTIYMVTDGGGANSIVWRSIDNGITWYDVGGRTNGRHSTIVPLDNSGTLLSYGGKNSNINGWMPWCKSYDWGATWPEAGPAPFAVLGSNQRPNLIRLANGDLVMVGDCQRKGDNYQPPGWSLGYGCYIAVSDDDGASWHFKKFPVTLPHESDRQYGTLGYSTVRQASNGVIHVLTTMTHPCLHYELNEEWIYSADGDIAPETTGGAVNQYTEYYPGGSLRNSWSARTCPNGRYLLHGTETSYYPDGKKEHHVTYNNGRKTGTETFLAPDGVKLWSWQHDDVNNISLWSNYWSNGLKRIESRLNSYPTARDLPTRHFSGFVADGTTYHWDRSGQAAKAYSFSDGNYLGETSLPSAQTKGGIDLEIFVRNWLWMGMSGGDGYDEADLNKDGLVNFADFAAFASQ